MCSPSNSLFFFFWFEMLSVFFFFLAGCHDLVLVFWQLPVKSFTFLGPAQLVLFLTSRTRICSEVAETADSSAFCGKQKLL